MKLNAYLKICLLIALAIGIYYATTNLDYFDTVYSVEDGFLENSQFILIFCSSILLFYRFFRLFKHRSLNWKIGVFLMASVFLFGAGEEISWGQRIFNVQSSEYFFRKQ